MLSPRRSLVTRRLVFLATVFTLAPALLTAAFAIWMLRDQTIEHAGENLVAQARSYSLSLSDRMGTLHSSLDIWLSGHQANPSLPLGLSRIVALTSEQAGYLSEHLSANELKAVRQGRPLLIPSFPGPVAMGRMSVLMEDRGQWLLGLVDENFLWGPLEYFPSGVFLCVRQQDGNPLHCPRPQGMALLASQSSHKNLPASERLLHGASNTELGAAWANDTWRVTASQKTSMALAPMPEWHSIFLPSVVLACMVTVVLVFFRIRNRLEPLAQLSAATSRLAAGDFDIALKIDTGDEFERLGKSLNRMSRRLGYQVGALRALADMDRLILAGEGLQPLVGRAMECLVSTPGVDKALLLLGPDEGESMAYRAQGQGDFADIIGTLSYGQFERIMNSRLDDAGRCLDQVGLQAIKSVLGEGTPVCLPVLLDASLIGVLLVIGERRYSAEDEQLRHMMRDLADRIAVAISSLKRKELLFRQAHFDSLTELPNRDLFKDRLAQALAAVQRNEELGALMFLDLDRFKAVNDSEGHSAGDLLLVEAARRLKGNLRMNDTVARLGGDEFTVVLGKVHSAQEAARVADELLAQLARPFIINDVEHFVGASIGITIFPTDGAEVEQLVRNADTAMYQAKNMGGGAIAFYNSDMNRRARARRSLETDLRHALERNEFVLVYQPQVNMESGQVVGAEALLRWQHPDRGLVGPGEFVSVAEETGLIVPIGDWVIQTACREFRRWQQECDLPVESISINASLRQFRRREIVNSLRKVLSTTGIDPASVEVEITESVLAEDVFEALGVLNMIHRLGVRIGIDDFGTGYSSLGYLKRFPFDTLKIDRVFLSDIPENRESLAIAEAVIAIARTLNKRIVAEGVETAAQLNFVRQSGCGIAQGMLLGRPMRGDAFVSWARNTGDQQSGQFPQISGSQATA